MSILLFAALLLAGDARGFDARVTAELERALACVNLSVSDLAWQKRPLDDPFRLSCVNETLDRPLALAERAERAEAELGAAAPADALRAARAWLDVPRTGAAPRAALASEGPPSERLARALAAQLAVARGSLELALAPLTPEQRTRLRAAAPRLYVDDAAEEEGLAPFLAAAKDVDLARIADAADAVAAALELAQAELPRLARSGPAPPRRLPIAGLAVAIGGEGDDLHRDLDVVVDRGGNDTYERCAFVVDLAGDDTYRDTGSGLLDAGLVVDAAGDDRHLGGTFAQGGAAAGAAALLDVAGSDRYEASQLSQGAAFLGVGVLFDLDGNDAYRGARFVQGFGGVRGFGLLSDRAGQDTYWAGGTFSHAPLLPESFQSLSQGCGFGLRPDASGGVGVLLDAAGNDTYSSEVYGQGASYWYALGILADSAGHDKYELFQYGQGAGIHLSPAILMDRAGQDAYSCNNGVAQGSGHDWGVGVLWDRAGNDYYQGSGMSQGGANANGMGLVVDEGGNDAWSGSGDKNQGDSFFARGTFGLGVLLDLGGKDRYTHGGRDGSTWTRGTVGVGRDVAEEAQP